MFEAPNMPTDKVLARLSENDLFTQRKEALQAFNDAKSEGRDTTELGKIYKALDAENERRMKNKRMR